MKRNEYVELATRTLSSLCEEVASLERELPATASRDLRAEAIEEAHGLWHLLVWADRRLNASECAVLDAIVRASVEAGRPIPVAVGDKLSRVPEFLRLAATLDAMEGRRRASRMINHLEAFGFALLAADREISEVELKTLKGYVRGLRQKTGSLYRDLLPGSVPALAGAQRVSPAISAL